MVGGRGGEVGSRWGKFFKEVVFKVDFECYFIVLKTKVTETVPFGGVGEIGNVAKRGQVDFRDGKLVDVSKFIV